MPFRQVLKIPYLKRNTLQERRKIRTMQNKILPSRSIRHTSAGRASVFTSMKGSITLEAATAVPIFFFAVLCLLFLMEIMAIQTAVRSGLQYAGKQAAAGAYPAAVLTPGQIERDVISAIGAARLERSIIEGGIDCSGSRMSPRTGVAELSAVCQVKIPLPIFQIPLLEYEQKMRIKGWTGYEKTGFGGEDDETVYVTETGLVYHQDYHCTHLELSIRMVNPSEVADLRNESGGKYYACEHCKKGGTGGVYITDTGNRYHSSLSCSGLKRTVYAVPVSEVIGKGACSRCGR